ncbi:MAG: hypothetical protein RL544_1882 [Bacteroidota bacterium]
MKSQKALFRVSIILFLLIGVVDIYAQSNDTIVHFIFTSDVHFGLAKDHFRGKEKVSAFEVNKAMVQFMNQLPSLYLPKDSGVEQSNQVNGIDALVITGDIANRMEKGIQSATQSWEQFKTVFIDSLHLKNSKSIDTKLWVVPGNHDMSNAIGFHKPMSPKKDPASMIGIYNLMFPDKPISKFDSSLHRIHYSKDLNGVHFIFLSLFPDSAERVWMEKDLKKVKPPTPVLLFAHSIPDVEPRFFENPSGIHDINDEDKFENLVPERYKDGKDVKGETTIEQNGFVDFLKKHNNIKVYFHGHENWTEYYQYKGPENNVSLACIRTDSPMKGRVSAKDETKLAFELISINSNAKMLTVREILWNANKSTNEISWGKTATFSLK